MVVRGPPASLSHSQFDPAALAPGNSDHSKPIAPVTNGAAALVPPEVQLRRLFLGW